MTDDSPLPAHRRFLWIGVLLAIPGLYLVSTDAPVGWVPLALGGMVFFAGLIGTAVRPAEPRTDVQPAKRRPWDDR